MNKNEDPLKTNYINSRNVSIDLFRAFAIILITGFHVSIFLDNPAKPLYIFDFYAPFHKGSVGVAIFVFISGYLTHSTSSQLALGNFIKRRLLRIALPYYIAILIMNLLLFFKIFSSGSHDFIDNITHLLFIHNLYPKTFYTLSGVYWYIGLQVQLYIMYLLIRPYVHKYWFSLGFIAFIFTICTNCTHYSTWGEVVTKSIFSYAFLFLLGVIIKNREDILLPILRKPFIFYSCLIAAIIWLFLKEDLIGHGELDCMSIGFLLGLVMLGMPKINQNNIVVRPLLLVGTASYSIFLYNFTFWTFAPQLYYIKGLLMYTFITIAIGITMFYFIEEPIMREIKKS